MTTEQQIEILITENQELQKKVEQLQFELKAADSDYHYKTKALIDEIDVKDAEKFLIENGCQRMDCNGEKCDFFEDVQPKDLVEFATKHIDNLFIKLEYDGGKKAGEIEAVEFAEWCDKQVTYIDENGNVDYKQLYKIFKNR